jgi:hypothetical protein
VQASSLSVLIFAKVWGPACWTLRHCTRGPAIFQMGPPLVQVLVDIFKVYAGPCKVLALCAIFPLIRGYITTLAGFTGLISLYH